MPRTKLDKIFDNKYHEFDPTEENLSIDFHSEYFVEDSDSQYNNVAVDELLKDIDEIITEHFQEFKVVENNKTKRVNKKDINRIYTKSRSLLIKKYTIINIWNYVAFYFDIDTNRFFDSLDDVHKSELTNYLLNNTEILKEKKLDNMF